jgi:hypothetical protein
MGRMKDPPGQSGYVRRTVKPNRTASTAGRLASGHPRRRACGAGMPANGQPPRQARSDSPHVVTRGWTRTTARLVKWAPGPGPLNEPGGGRDSAKVGWPRGDARPAHPPLTGPADALDARLRLGGLGRGSSHEAFPGILPAVLGGFRSHQADTPHSPPRRAPQSFSRPPSLCRAPPLRGDLVSDLVERRAHLTGPCAQPSTLVSRPWSRPRRTSCWWVVDGCFRRGGPGALAYVAVTVVTPVTRPPAEPRSPVPYRPFLP